MMEIFLFVSPPILQLALVAGIVGLVVFLLHRLRLRMGYGAIFFPSRRVEKTPDLLQLPWEDVYFPSSDGKKLNGWFIPHEQPLATLLFFHGNAGNMATCLENLRLFHYIGLTIFIVDYRGYGKSQGHPTEKGLYQDAEGAFRYLTEQKGIAAERIVVFGRSLGGPVATWLATRHAIGALILECTFTSILDLIDVLLKPALRWIARQWVPVLFPTRKMIAGVSCPILIFHGMKDEIIPVHFAQQLYEAAPNPKIRYLIPRAKHNDTFIVGGEKYWYLLKAFIQKSLAKDFRASLLEEPFPEESGDG